MEADKGVSHESICEEAWKVVHEAFQSVAELVGDAANGEDQNANGGCNWEEREGVWEADDEGKTVFDEVVQTSVCTVVHTLFAILVERDNADIRIAANSWSVEELVGTEVTVAHDLLLEVSRQEVEPDHHVGVDDDTQEGPGSPVILTTFGCQDCELC